jgi:hypothetical protein
VPDTLYSVDPGANGSFSCGRKRLSVSHSTSEALFHGMGEGNEESHEEGLAVGRKGQWGEKTGHMWVLTTHKNVIL